MTSLPLTELQPVTRILATPYARRLARDRGVPIFSIVGSGPNGRRTANEVLAYTLPNVDQAREMAPVMAQGRHAS